jgi:D-sedoheptulose 7-phosphate isomerase
MEKIKDAIEESLRTKEALLADDKLIGVVSSIIKEIERCYARGNKILVAGNGGSAADAQHFAAEFVCRYKKERRGYPAIALTTDSSVLTAWGNDYDFDTVFARQVEALGNKNDIFFGISTSGNSKNIIKAFAKAKEQGLITVSLLGKDGGALKGVADLEIIVPSDDVPRIQESHIMIIHIICEEVEKKL